MRKGEMMDDFDPIARMNRNLPPDRQVDPDAWDKKMKKVEADRAQWRKKAHKRRNSIMRLRSRFMHGHSSSVELKPKSKTMPGTQRRSEGVTSIEEAQKFFPLLTLTSRQSVPSRMTTQRTTTTTTTTTRTMRTTRTSRANTLRPMSSQSQSRSRTCRVAPCEYPKKKPQSAADMWPVLIWQLKAKTNALRAKLVNLKSDEANALLDDWHEEPPADVKELGLLLDTMKAAAERLWKDVRLRNEGLDPLRKPVGTLTILKKKNPGCLNDTDIAILGHVFPRHDTAEVDLLPDGKPAMDALVEARVEALGKKGWILPHIKMITKRQNRHRQSPLAFKVFPKARSYKIANWDEIKGKDAPVIKQRLPFKARSLEAGSGPQKRPASRMKGSRGRAISSGATRRRR
mmetsp:Transcript_3229/g.6332  ORF Transcript_3229/g.6332 Transcript_3229/m.6332 type:complete len:401 (-) Transcript_3229:119-1321(-)